MGKGQVKYRKSAVYFIDMPGMALEGMPATELDKKYALVLIPTSSSMAVVPRMGLSHPPLEQVVFYANCLAYAHDVPALVVPARRTALVLPLFRQRTGLVNESYYNDLQQALECLNSIRFGYGHVYFVGTGDHEEVELACTRDYSKVRKEISLYSTALMQLDPLSEFLCYYRILESVAGDNGKDWVRKNLRRLKAYDFGFVELGDYVQHGGDVARRRNIFGVHKKRALARLKKLTSRIGQRELPKYFYNEIRCGIAHGKTTVKVYDFKHNIEEISKDNHILKLLARIAIEDRK